LESGSQAPIGTVNAFEQLPPGAAKQIEVGAKVDISGAVLTAAYFDIERPLEIVNAENRFVQDGQQIHRGIELQAQGQIGQRLNIITGVTWLDAQIADNGNPDLAGNRPVGVPEWTATFFADYSLPFLEGSGLNAGVVYEGRQFFDLTNERAVGDWVRFDVGGRYEFEVGDQPLLARFFITNVLNTRYWSVGNFPGLSLSAPRTLGVSLSASF
jgi:iron complex outermembrane receptor protein